MAKNRLSAPVLTQSEIAPGIFSMEILAPEIAACAIPGQFVSLYCHDRDHLLPRPISLCEINRDAGTLRLVYRVAGYGTKEFSLLRSGSSVDVLGPLGNGYRFPEGMQHPLFIGGGIGIPPMLALAKASPVRGVSVLGYRDALFLSDDFAAVSDLLIATEDGSTGTKGTVIDAMNASAVTADVLFACGPTPMLRALKAWAQEKHLPLYVSMEERMACGVGACLGCVVKSTHVDDHSHVNNKRVCKDGPVFDAAEVCL